MIPTLEKEYSSSSSDPCDSFLLFVHFDQKSELENIYMLASALSWLLFYYHPDKDENESSNMEIAARLAYEC